ncbi:ELL-associated factor 1 [Periplaneta americana]|uniref:ELL-associated factor 1 n=1 Tax=Periplaneta americana TaxID=6978 RepID=UPI0037E9066D
MQKCQLNGVNGDNMADKLGLGREVRELKLGPSFTNSRGNSFHTLRYDFKPASVDVSKVATVDVGQNQQVTVTVPHLDGAGTPHTVFKGSQRPYHKECVLIIDRVTGEITLEKLSTNIQVKKTRMETIHKLAPPPPSSSRPLTPVDSLMNSHSRNKLPSPQHRSNKKKTSPKPNQLTSTLGCIPRHSPLHASPSYPTSRSPSRGLPPQHKSPPSLPGSLPVIGLEDSDLGFGSSYTPSQPPQQPDVPDYARPADDDGGVANAEDTGILSDSSSDSSDSSGSSSGSDSEAETQPSNSAVTSNGHINGTASPSLSMPDHLLSEDLQLSESGSESD